jgi:hypothetical protein
MVKGKHQAMDSVHVKANASMDSLKEKQILEDGEVFTGELTEEADEDKGRKDKGHSITVSSRKHQAVNGTTSGRTRPIMDSPAPVMNALSLSPTTPISLPPIPMQG